ncbi:MFS transporter [Thermobifida fusca]|jgi:metabolite-proton symporter|uniref:Putative proline/betaine transporter n=2 Tax=Thermobifida fusca TaxID=2021 RepID=A0A9P2T9I4_THEFU|nr:MULTISPECIES: MFS transporter [Thermobifida]AAZ55829.1 major facilitator family transporter [Thermobifida fusca YX]EOR71124.1 major facilitator family transporter [Thermobifida fusca TM51]MBO2529050.1 MFS transporter [Thermobifida sp.]PPS92208.1 LysR family transcriptional regulator [Thermobifida fusca]PZN65433.1 MAG: MFS transporter [Thermobifida fusca]
MSKQSPPTTSSPLRAAIASFVGTTIEWFDFYIYATAASLIFATAFFPEDTDPLVGLMASFATFAVGFFARPLGGIIFGHYGDRVGRKSALVTTLVMMGTATFLVGLLPTYKQIGFVAPLLLVVLRFVQGIAVGGEWGGAVLISVEHAPENKKTFYGSFAQLGNPAGALLATGSFSLIAAVGNDFLYSWGWRLPFLASIVLVAVGLMIRLKVEESPVFTAVQEKAPKELPLRAALQGSWKPLLLGIGVLPVAVGGYYVVTTFLQSYGVTEVGVSEQVILNGLSVAAFVELVATLGVSWLGDRFGTVRVVVLGLIGVIILAVPQFLVLETGSTALIFLALALMRLVMAATYGPIARVLAQMYPPEARYTSVSLAYQVAGAIFGGLSPLVCTALYAATGTIYSVAGLLILMALVSIACLVKAPRYRDSDVLAAAEA